MSVSPVFGANAAAMVRAAKILRTASTGDSATALPSGNGQTPAGLKTYDFTSITPKDLLITVNKLIKNGTISVDESSSLVGMMSGSPLNKVNYDGNAPDTADEPMDVFASLKQYIKFNGSIHNESGVEYGKKALDALQKIQGRAASVDISV